MSGREAPVGEAVDARVVHRSVMAECRDGVAVIKLMFNVQAPTGHEFTAGSDVAFVQPGHTPDQPGALRHYTIEAVGEVPFESSIDITIFVRAGGGAEPATANHLLALRQGDHIPLYGPFPYPFYPPMGSRSNMIVIGAGSGLVPFRWLALKVHARRLDWMGKVLMLHGDQTGLEHLYVNDPAADQDQYFDTPTYRAFEALKTRYSATASDRDIGIEAHLEAVWRLMGQGSVFVYLAGYRSVAAALDRAMADYLRLPGRWEEAKAALARDGHWLEFLYD